MSRDILSARQWYLTARFSEAFYRLVSIEQGGDGSLYVKWNLSLSGDRPELKNDPSYRSYHVPRGGKGNRVHQHGLHGETLAGSIEYRPEFAPTRRQRGPFMQITYARLPPRERVDRPGDRDLVFRLPAADRVRVLLFNPARADLLERRFGNAVCRPVELNGFPWSAL